MYPVAPVRKTLTVMVKFGWCVRSEDWLRSLSMLVAKSALSQRSFVSYSSAVNPMMSIKLLNDD